MKKNNNKIIVTDLMKRATHILFNIAIAEDNIRLAAGKPLNDLAAVDIYNEYNKWRIKLWDLIESKDINPIMKLELLSPGLVPLMEAGEDFGWINSPASIQRLADIKKDIYLRIKILKEVDFPIDTKGKKYDFYYFIRGEWLQYEHKKYYLTQAEIVFVSLLFENPGMNFDLSEFEKFCPKLFGETADKARTLRDIYRNLRKKLGIDKGEYFVIEKNKNGYLFNEKYVE